jgi:multidrug efflux pump subunit AcrA (membrane-fusion protein)
MSRQPLQLARTSWQQGVCIVSVWALSCTSSAKPQEPAESPHTPPAREQTEVSDNVRWSPVRRAKDVQSFEGTGKLLAPPGSRAELTLPLSATVLAVHVAPGESVEKGSPLIDVAIPEAARAQGQFEGARLRVNAYNARLKALEALSEQGLAKGSELAEARARVAEAQAIAREAEAVLDTVESAGVEREGKHYRVVAPIAGMVVAMHAPLGSTRGPTDGPLCTISGGAPTRVEARFAFTLPREATYELWQPGQRLASVKLLSQAPEVSPNDATRVAWFELTEPTDLAQGTTVRVRLRLPDDAWVVPAHALRPGPKPDVRTQSHGVVQVQVLASFGSEALVRGDLREGDALAEDDGP